MNKFIYQLRTSFLLLLLFIGTVLLVGCNEDSKKEPEKDKNINTHTEYKILEDTIYETTVHIYKSNIAGPKVIIIGGIHGDEVAGWTAALNLLNKDDFQGEVMVIPQANILADNLEQRYPGAKTNDYHDGIKYSDLNRTFPGLSNGSMTERIAYAITQEVINFNPEYVIDLHESRRSVTDPKPLLGDLVIYGNKKSALIAVDISLEFNEKYKLSYEVNFGTDSNSPEGSCNNYFAKELGVHTFTFETNRQLDLTRRIEQQTQLLSVFFDYIWK